MPSLPSLLCPCLFSLIAFSSLSCPFSLIVALYVIVFNIAILKVENNITCGVYWKYL